ncbi:unnamed protein product, partial [Staurois parvus]
MIRTSHRGPIRRSAFHCVRRIQGALDRGAACSQREDREAIYKRPPDPALPPSGCLYTTAGREVV